MSEVSLRAMTVQDVDAVCALEQSVFPDPWSRDSFITEATGGAGHWHRVAVAPSGEVIGYAVAWTVADEVHLGNIAVVAGWRRRGIAQKLLNDLVQTGTQREARMVILEVRRSNVAAQALYKKNGFYTVMIRRGYYRDNREDAMVMVRPLTAAGALPPVDETGR